jgi:hypothetical protein
MGAVYRATDTSLNRQVAIKVLPDAFAQDVGRLARFERQAIAATLRAERDPEPAARQLLAQANDAGGRGNITLVIVRFDRD